MWGNEIDEMSALSSNVKCRDFRSSPVVKNPPCNTRDMGSIPGQGTNNPHAIEKLSPLTTTTEPTHPGAYRS